MPSNTGGSQWDPDYMEDSPDANPKTKRRTVKKHEGA